MLAGVRAESLGVIKIKSRFMQNSPLHPAPTPFQMLLSVGFFVFCFLFKASESLYSFASSFPSFPSLRTALLACDSGALWRRKVPYTQNLRGEAAPGVWGRRGWLSPGDISAPGAASVCSTGREPREVLRGRRSARIRSRIHCSAVSRPRLSAGED